MLIRIMACKEREDCVNKIISDVGAPVEVVWDEKHNANDTLCRMLDTDEPFLAMEDDIELCDGFLEKVLKEIKNRPDSFIQFYSFGPVESREFKDDEYDGGFAITQAYYVPAGVGKKMAEYLRKDFLSNIQNDRRYDLGMYRFLKINNIKMHLVKPSLCQHLCFTSLINDRTHIKHTSKSYKKE